jgi:type I restriction enzyme S subunit
MAGRIRNYFREDNFFDIPESGDIFPLKFICIEFSKYGANLSAENYVTEGSRFIRTSDIDDNGKLSEEGVYIDEQLVEEYKLKESDFLISRSGTLGRGYLYNSNDGLCSYAGYLVKYSLNQVMVNPKFIFYSTKTNQFENWLKYSVIEATIGNINGEKYANLPIPVPSLTQQNKIVDYLNDEIAKIDALIEKKIQLLAALEEKKKAIINQAVTKGLDTKISMKDSGIEWLGEVPEHWGLERLKFLTIKIGSGVTPSGGAEVYTDEGVLFLRSQNVYNDGLHLEDETYISENVHNNMKSSQVKTNDLLLNITGGSIGRCYYFDLDIQANVNQHVCILRVNDKIFYRYLHFTLISFIGQFQIDLLQYGGGREAISFENIKNFWVPLPSFDNQKHIVDILEKECAKFDSIISKVTEAKSLLQEKRTAIISAAINGELNSKLS